MAGLPADVGQGTITGKVVSAEQVAASDADVDAVALGGTVTFTPSVTQLIHTGSNVIILAQPITVALDVNGAFTTKLVATDDIDLNPQDWTYTVSFALSGTAVRVTPFSITVPAGSTQDLADIIPVATSEGVLVTQGASAYEVAVDNGFVGDEAAWVASLGGLQVFSAQTDTYTLVASDVSKVITMTKSSGMTLYIPTDANLTWAIGARVDVLVMGTGMVTVAAVTPGSTTVTATPSLISRAQWSSFSLIKRAANAWVGIGDFA
jgi:hypothetical protein